MAISNTQELFVHELCELYDAEHRFIEGQQETIEHATDEGLSNTLLDHLDQTRQHAANIEQVFSELGQEARRQPNEVARGLVTEAQEGIQEAQSNALCDVVIDAAVIKVEHFEMGSYRNLVTGAQLMGQNEVQRLLSENMQDEEQTAQIAERSAEDLLAKAMQEEGKEPEAGKGFIDKAKDKLTGD